MDLVLRGGTVVDGTGSPGYRADVGVHGGRIVTIGTVDERGDNDVDADGLVVAPGFVDLHTHYDAQLFYEPVLSPSPLHGVTTVIGGNCGLTLAPVAPGDESWLTRLLARVESIPVTTSKPVLEYRWRTYPEFLDVVDAQPLGPNVGFLVGHSAIRRAVMGTRRRAPRPRPSSSRRCKPCSTTRSRLAASGFSDRQRGHAGRRRRPPDAAELRDPRRVRRARRGVRAVTPAPRSSSSPTRSSPVSPDDDVELMADMSAAANRVLNWNKPLVNKQLPDLHRRQLRACDVAIARGGRVVPMMTPQNGSSNTTSSPATCSARCPAGVGCSSSRRPIAVSRSRTPTTATRLEQSVADATTGLALVVRNWSSYIVNEVHDSTTRSSVGRRIEDLAREWGMTPFEAMAEVACRAGLDTGFVRPQFVDGDEWSWAVRPRAAHRLARRAAGVRRRRHLDMMCGAAYPTEVLAELVREREALHARSDGAPVERRAGRVVRIVRAGTHRRRRARRPRGVRTPTSSPPLRCRPGGTSRRGGPAALRRDRHGRRVRQRTRGRLGGLVHRRAARPPAAIRAGLRDRARPFCPVTRRFCAKVGV
jgi:hypothetical protein